MRYLGVDYGEKRIGLALSDGAGRIALPHGTVHTIADIQAVVERFSVARIVVGMPTSLDGQPSAQTRRTQQFGARLRDAVELPVVFENEVFTTKIARTHSSQSVADASAAALILQSYLDRQCVEQKT